MSEDAGGDPADEAPGPEGSGAQRRRLDPDRAAAARSAGRHRPPQMVDTRRYQRTLGLFALLLVVGISASFLLSRRPGTQGVPAGRTLPIFAAPLAASTLNGAANLRPHCTPAQHDPRALNVCLVIKRVPLVLAFFVTSSGGCEQQVTALQAVSHRYRASQVEFAAVAIGSDHQDALSAVRAHRWTVPVAYDVDGRVGAVYGIGVCPIVELARRGGQVFRRLIGEHWNSTQTLAPVVRDLVAGGGS